MTLREEMHAIFASLLFVLTEGQNLAGELDGFLSPREMEDYRLPVPFGHIYKEGYGNPYSDLKQPLDLLELNMRTPKNAEEAKRLLLETANKNKIMYLRKIDTIMPRGDGFLQGELSDGDEGRNFKGNKSDDWPKLENLADIQNRNAMTPHPRNTHIEKKETKVVYETPIAPQAVEIPHKDFFTLGGFDLDRKQDKINWTTCDEFGSKTFLDPRHIVDIDWVPFYTWSITPSRYAIVHRFSYPKKTLVKKYYDNYHLHLNKSVDWQQPKLLLMSGIDEFLLIAANKRGLFVAIHEHNLPSSIKDMPILIPTVYMKLKIEDPYLVLMFCDNYYATVMAVSGDGPTTYKDKIAEAAIVGFRGIGGPVWRDLKDEKMMRDSMIISELINDADKMINIDEPLPPIFEHL